MKGRPSGRPFAFSRTFTFTESETFSRHGRAGTLQKRAGGTSKDVMARSTCCILRYVTESPDLHGDMAVAPLLRWAGSKRRILDLLHSRVPSSFGTYVEPFAGSACLFFKLQPPASILSDFNPKLIDLYVALRGDVEEFMRRLYRIPVNKDSYLSVRATLGRGVEDQMDRAVFFYFLSHLAFNGIYRENRLGQFNVPFGSRASGLPQPGSFRLASRALCNTRLLTNDFAVTTSGVKAGDFVYLDPPYRTSARSAYGEFGYGSFAGRDAARLLEELKRLDDLGAKVLFSYAASPGLVDALPAWRTEFVHVRRTVAANHLHRRPDVELLMRNYDVEEDLGMA